MRSNNQIIKYKGHIAGVLLNKSHAPPVFYGPSYITGQTALAFWNMIPERVELIISMTTKREMKEFLALMRLDDSVNKDLDLSLLEEIKTGYRRQSIKLLLDC